MAMEDSSMMSPADIAALTRGNTGFGGDGISWLVLILLFFGFMGGGWGGRYGNGELGQYATAASQQDILFGQHFGQINDRLTNIGNGVCSLGNNGVIIGSAGCPCVCNDAAGYYSVSVNTTLVASAAGPVTVTLYQDGQAVSGATQTVTAAAADSVGIAFTAPVRVYRGQVSSRLQVIVTGQAVTTSNVAVEVVKE